MVVKGKRWILFFVLIWSFFPCQSVYGAEVSSDLSINDYNFSGIEEALKQQGMDSFSFQEVVKLLMKGEVVEAVNKIGDGIMNTILQEFIGNKKLLIQLVAVSIFSGSRFFCYLFSCFYDFSIFLWNCCCHNKKCGGKFIKFYESISSRILYIRYNGFGIHKFFGYLWTVDVRSSFSGLFYFNNNFTICESLLYVANGGSFKSRKTFFKTCRNDTKRD